MPLIIHATVTTVAVAGKEYWFTSLRRRVYMLEMKNDYESN